MRAVLSGGGTGGHIYPAVAVARSLLKENWEILYLGSVGGLEGKIIPEEGLPYKEIKVAPLPRKLSLKLLSSFFKTSQGYFSSRKILKEFKPDVVLGTGGFVAGPVILAASHLRIPTLIHEQNVYPGFTNRLLARYVDGIALNFAAAARFLPSSSREKQVVTGNPIRELILTTGKKEGLKALDLQEGKKTLLVFGGSQGAQSINEAMLEIYLNYQKNSQLQIVHITGPGNYQKVLLDLESKGIELNKCRHYKIMPYLKNMEYALAAADLVVYRAGATGLAEITAKGIPAILIPYPHAAGNHQEYNARLLVEKGAALMIKDAELTGRKLLARINELLASEEKLARMRKEALNLGQPEAREKLVQFLKETALKNGQA